MYTLIVGREGNQPFPILEEGVGRQHLQVVVPDQLNDVWEVTDLESTNGTFVQQQDGSYERMYGSQKLAWNTVLRMGPDNMYGRTFWLCQLTQTDPNDYSLQFSELNRRLNILSAEKKKQVEEQERQKKKSAILKAIIIASVSTLAFIVLPPEWGYMRLAVLPLAGAIVPFMFQNGNSSQLIKDYKAVFRCPNGKCGRPLSEYDIRRGQCPVCKAHI